MDFCYRNNEGNFQNLRFKAQMAQDLGATKNSLSNFLPFQSKAKFKEFDPRFKFKSRLKYGWFHLNLYSIFQDLSRRSIKTGF